MIRTALAALGLMFVILPQSAHARDFPRCGEAGCLHHFDPRLAAPPCEIITNADIH